MSTATSKISPCDRPHQLALGVAELGVEAAQRPAHREGVVVLDEGLGDAALAVLLLVVGLEEEAAVVA